MGFLFMFFYFLTFSLVLSSFLPPVQSGKEELAKEYAERYLLGFYRGNREFPTDFKIPFYPLLEYSSGGERTPSSGVISNPAYAVATLAGKDGEFGTVDDIRMGFTALQLEKGNYIELRRRAKVLEQAFYMLCQTKLAETGTPYYPPDLATLVREANLPDWYRFTPFGAEYRYDASSCNATTCYCEGEVITPP
jgi:hypothetical protein